MQILVLVSIAMNAALIIAGAGSVARFVVHLIRNFNKKEIAPAELKPALGHPFRTPQESLSRPAQLAPARTCEDALNAIPKTCWMCGAERDGCVFGSTCVIGTYACGSVHITWDIGNQLYTMYATACKAFCRNCGLKRRIGAWGSFCSDDCAVAWRGTVEARAKVEA